MDEIEGKRLGPSKRGEIGANGLRFTPYSSPRRFQKLGKVAGGEYLRRGGTGEGLLCQRGPFPGKFSAMYRGESRDEKKHNSKGLWWLRKEKIILQMTTITRQFEIKQKKKKQGGRAGEGEEPTSNSVKGEKRRPGKLLSL